MSIDISPSILSANKEKMSSELSLANEAGAKFIHLDVMDGKFVTNTTFSYPYVKEICALDNKLIKDTHLMIEKPWKYLKKFVDSGSQIVTFHYEACNKKQIYKCIKILKNKGVLAGISIKPNTNVSVLDDILPFIDLVLIMSVEPGKGGQMFMENSLDKIAYLDKKRRENGYEYKIEVDGGINLHTGERCVKAGVDILVAGSYLYGHEDFIERARGLLGLCR